MTQVPRSSIKRSPFRGDDRTDNEDPVLGSFIGCHGIYAVGRMASVYISGLRNKFCKG